MGAGQHVLTPYRGRGRAASQKAANRAHAQRRAPGERASAQLKTWHILRKLRCCPWKAGHIAKAIHVFQTRETAGRKGSLSTAPNGASTPCASSSPPDPGSRQPSHPHATAAA
jgi:hypothetical protein